MPTLHKDFADFLRLLNARNVRYLVVGGYPRRVEVSVDSLTVPFISLADLIKNKTSSRRGKDLVDAEALQKRTKK